MKQSRKTFDVETFKNECNVSLARPDKGDWMNEDIRKGICLVLENVLHESGNYHGFGYVELWQPGIWDTHPKDCTPDEHFAWMAQYLKHEYMRFYS